MTNKEKIAKKRNPPWWTRRFVVNCVAMDSSNATMSAERYGARAAAAPLPWSTKLIYGAPSFAGAAMIIPILIHMPKFYADVVLVPLGYLAIAIAVARSLDAISDPIMGWISDRTRTPLGRRRPYLLAATPLCAIAFCALLSPPRALGGGSAALWFGVTFILYFIFHTAYVLPHYALGPELTLNYHERSTLFAVREGFSILGTIVASAAPGFMQQRMHLGERQVFFRMAVTFGILLVVLYWILALTIRERPDFAARESNPLVPGVRRALRNRPFAILLASYVVGSITGAIPATMMPFFNAYVIRPKNPQVWLSIFLLGYFAAGFLSLPLWLAAARRFGKLNSWLASMLLGVTGGGAMFLLGPGDTTPLLFLIMWAGLGFGAGLFLTPSMQADVIDYDEFHTGKRREAQYAAFWSMLPKFVAIPSASIPIAILASLGYVPNAMQNPQVVMAIRVIFALGPAIFGVLAFLIARSYPITEGIHAQILEGIEEHKEGRAAPDPLTRRVVAPAASHEVDEDTGWFLDYFSARELRRYLERGSASPVADVVRSASIAGAVCAGAALIVAARASTLQHDPGAIVSLLVVVAGFAFAVVLFHLMRLAPARRLAAGAVPADAIRAHLADSAATPSAS